MLTLEIHGKFISWPEDFAVLMMKYYRDNGVNFIVHGNCAHSGRKSVAANNFMSNLMESAEFQKYTFCCCHQSAGS
jgi:hypothetical protein